MDCTKKRRSVKLKVSRGKEIKIKVEKKNQKNNKGQSKVIKVGSLRSSVKSINVFPPTFRALTMVRMIILADALKSISNAEKRGKP